MANLELAAAFGAADAAKEQDLRGYYPMAARVLADEVRRRKAGQDAQAELEKLRAENAALKRDLQYARDGLTKGRSRMREDNKRLLEALGEVLAWGTDENYERAKVACNTARSLLGPNVEAKAQTRQRLSP